jgi:hypothetical protein
MKATIDNIVILTMNVDEDRQQRVYKVMVGAETKEVRIRLDDLSQVIYFSGCSENVRKMIVDGYNDI